VKLEKLENAICHICKKRTDIGYHFQCAMKNHVYCEYHVKKRLKGVTEESGSYVYDSCPICSLTCECAKCVRKLRDVATLFKAKCIGEKKKPLQLKFPELLSICRNMIPQKQLNDAIDTLLDNKKEESRRLKDVFWSRHDQEAAEKGAHKSTHAKQTRTIELLEQTMVPKPPLSHFPVEVNTNDPEYNDSSMHPYFTVYSAEGRRAVTNIPNAWLDEENGTILGSRFSQTPKNKNNLEVQEDGNIDYCHICSHTGRLILLSSRLHRKPYSIQFCQRSMGVLCL